MIKILAGSAVNIDIPADASTVSFGALAGLTLTKPKSPFQAFGINFRVGTSASLPAWGLGVDFFGREYVPVYLNGRHNADILRFKNWGYECSKTQPSEFFVAAILGSEGVQSVPMFGVPDPTVANPVPTCDGTSNYLNTPTLTIRAARTRTSANFHDYGVVVVDNIPTPTVSSILRISHPSDGEVRLSASNFLTFYTNADVKRVRIGTAAEEALQVSGGIKLNHDNDATPPCAGHPQFRGLLWFQYGTDKDTVYICAMQGGTLAWRAIF